MTLLKQKKYDIAYLKMAKEWAKLSIATDDKLEH